MAFITYINTYSTIPCMSNNWKQKSSTGRSSYLLGQAQDEGNEQRGMDKKIDMIVLNTTQIAMLTGLETWTDMFVFRPLENPKNRSLNCIHALRLSRWFESLLHSCARKRDMLEALIRHSFRQASATKYFTYLVAFWGINYFGSRGILANITDALQCETMQVSWTTTETLCLLLSDVAIRNDEDAVHWCV